MESMLQQMPVSFRMMLQQSLGTSAAFGPDPKYSSYRALLLQKWMPKRKMAM